MKTFKIGVVSYNDMKPEQSRSLAASEAASAPKYRTTQSRWNCRSVAERFRIRGRGLWKLSILVSVGQAGTGV